MSNDHNDKRRLEYTLENSINPERLNNIKKVLTEVKRHFIPINDLVKTPASTKYQSYNLMWNRDSAYSSLYITRFIENSKKNGIYDVLREEIDELSSLNSKLIDTLWEGLDSEIKKIKMNGYESDITKNESKLGCNHILSRFDIDENGIKRAENDRNENKATRSWTMQYDSAPLILQATLEYIENNGYKDISKSIELMKKNLNFIISYIYNFHTTPCADAWEQYYYYQREETTNGQLYVGKTIDVYSLATMYKGIKSGKKLSELLKIKPYDVDEEDIIKFIKSNFIVNDEKRGQFLTKSKIEFGDTLFGVGAEEIEIFYNFMPDVFEDYRENTIKVIKDELFDDEFLPIRYKFFGKNRNIIDRYFNRGQWFHLGLQYAMYLKSIGNNEEAEKIIKYVEGKINEDGSIPEQEISNKKKVDDPDKFFEKNGNKTIQCLLWAETAYLAAISMQ